MDHDTLKAELEHSATLKLLRSRNAPLIISFLYRQFKVKPVLELPQPELETRLEDYLEWLRREEAEVYPRSPKDYLNEWCEAQLLRKTFNQSDDPMLSLTPPMEKAIIWLEDLQQRDEFVGTESRFLQIFSYLKEIQDRSTTDIETRITQLERDRDRLQQEIDQIRATGTVERYNTTQLRERFLAANNTTRQLMADFKAIEQNFRNLTRTIQEAQLQENSRKGALVNRVLDADQELKESDQGRSFYAFWTFLMSMEKRQELKSLINTVYNLEELKSVTQEYTVLRSIERNLLNAGEYIVQSNHRLTEKLRQMLDERNLNENRRVAELILEVQRLALNLDPSHQQESNFWQITGDPEINLVMARPLHALIKPERQTFNLDFTDLTPVNLETELAELYNQFYIDERQLHRQIDALLRNYATITLAQLIKIYPITQGLPEVVAYLDIANKGDRHHINPDQLETITINSLEPDIQLRLALPQIIFHR
ncbi:MAG: DUF3375 domain-containing protein [Spirulina sp. DLM2.Bin59]|nr:MAG: DUF3375 domain-containing protein [Spirulina sp. DLM2.Bin59]